MRKMIKTYKNCFVGTDYEEMNFVMEKVRESIIINKKVIELMRQKMKKINYNQRNNHKLNFN